MSLENIQVFRNFADWRICTLTLTATPTTIYDLMSEDDKEAVGDRPVVCVDFSFESDVQTVEMSHSADAGSEGTVVLIAGVGPGRWVGPPIINAHKRIFLKVGDDTDQLKVILYTA